MTIKNAAIIVAAGRGHRLGGEIPKQYLDIGGTPVLRRTIDIFKDNPLIDYIQVIIHPDDHELYENAIGDLELPTPIHGGDTRQQSVLNGLEAISDISPEYVYIHDAARPFLNQNILNDLIEIVEVSGAVIPALKVTDTIKYMGTDKIDSTLDRNYLYRAQTPQAFRYKAIFMAHRRFENDDMTDDSAIAEKRGLQVRIIAGSENNFKITTSEDLTKAEMMVGKTYTDVRTGYGVDVHAFEEGDHVMLGGIKIPHGKSLKGHSDADVALHAITDAVLGAMALGDIGDHFPPSDDKWKDASSDLFLKHAASLVEDAEGVIAHVDLTIICEAPKIAPHREKIRDRISEIIDLDIARISVKATTTEKLGFTGKGEGIMAQAVVTIRLPE
ncbi:MAG: bifunctional 2-C-methyl-D-erythritol 4-phosphate cytidylyltransferase/2-C-methyl-D-erythritol 2,4-cyclodiphosphate synthase [Emcibacteraceae bacterium]|nr:bifunctional 2-C-methyl-D-erythritol 4-phosphate cytidylyltransferase/2-C-methyl-D-erythritol 2,4-cyclodiphosphate synthase [Emcibacteraceae bacterium]